MSSELYSSSAIDLPRLPDGWFWRSLSDLVEPSRGICYGIVQPGTHDPDGVPMVNTGDILDGQVQSKVGFQVSKELHNKFKRSTLRGGELLVTLVGANFGRVAIAPIEYAGHNCSRAVGVVPIADDAEYVMFALRAPLVRHLMDTWANTTAQPTFNLKDLGNLPIPMPPTPIKESIRVLLKSFDDRIALLRETNATLEAIAQALFKSWFVDFDPVHANAGTQAPSLPPEIQALFSATFTDSPKGTIPDGWSVCPLDGTAHFLNGLALQKFPATNGEFLPVIKIAQLRKGDTSGADRASRDLKPEYIIQDGDVLFSWSGSLEVTIWCGGEGALNQHLFKVTSDKFPKWFYFLWTKYHLPNFQQIAASKATTMGHIQRKHLTEASVIIPPDNVLRAANEVFAPLIEGFINNSLQAYNLAALRDALLPRLISGQLHSREAKATLAKMS